MRHALGAVLLLCVVACESSKREAPAQDTPEPAPARAPVALPVQDEPPPVAEVMRERNIELVVATAKRSELKTTSCAAIGASCFTCTLAPSDEDAPPGESDVRFISSVVWRGPASLLRAAGLKRIAICTAIDFAGTADYDFGIVGGTIDHYSGTLFVKTEVEPLKVFHHELYHLFDRATMGDDAGTDAEFSALNPADFQYGRASSPPDVGFMDMHATRNVREDKATMYGLMAGRPHEMCATFAKDPIQHAKAELIRKRIRAAIGPDAAYLDWVDCK
jgi:hypothetical protein